MGFDLGAIHSKLVVDTQQFLAGLKQALQQVTSFQAQTQQAGKAIAANLSQTTARPAEQLKGFGAAMQASVRKVTDASSTDLARFFEQIQTNSAKVATGMAQGTEQTQAWGQAAAKAAEEGSHSFTEFGKHIGESALGFGLMQTGLGSIEQGLEGVKRAMEHLLDTSAEAEMMTLRVAKSFQISGQTGSDAFEATVEQAKQVVPQLRQMAHETGMASNTFIFLTQRVIETGISWREAGEFVQGFALALRGAFGESERFLRLQNELNALLQGEAQSATTLNRMIGTARTEQVAYLTAMGHTKAAIDLLTKALHLTGQEGKKFEQTLEAAKNRAQEAYVAAVTHSQSAARAAEAEKAHADALAQSYEKQTGFLHTGVELVGALAEGWATTKRYALEATDAMSKALVFYGRTPTGPGMEEAAREAEGKKARESEEARRTMLKAVYKQVTESGQAYTQTVGEQVALERSRLDVAAQQQKYNTDAVGSVKAEVANRIAALGLERQSLQTQLQVNQTRRNLLTLAGQLTSELDQTLRSEETNLRNRLASIPLEQRSAQIAGQREIILAQVAAYERDAGRAIQVQTAQGELRLAQMRVQGATGVQLATEEGRQKLASLRVEQRGLQQAAALLRQRQLTHTEEYRDLSAKLDANRAQQDSVRLAEKLAVIQAQVRDATRETKAAYDQIATAIQTASRMLEIERQIQESQLRMRLMTPQQREQAMGTSALDTREGQLNLESTRIAAERAEAIKQFGLDTAGRTADEVADLSEKYSRHLEQLDAAVILNTKNRDLLAQGRKELANLPELAMKENLAAGLQGAARNFIDSIAEGKPKLDALFQDIGKAFVHTIDEQLHSAINSLVESLTSFLKTNLGEGWAGIAMAGIGVAATAISSLFTHTKAQVESLGEAAKKNIQSTERTRGLLAGESTVAIAQLSENLSMAFRPTEGWLRSIDQRLQGIAGALGAPQSSVTAGGGISISAETLGAARV